MRQTTQVAQVDLKLGPPCYPSDIHIPNIPFMTSVKPSCHGPPVQPQMNPF